MELAVLAILVAFGCWMWFRETLQENGRRKRLRRVLEMAVRVEPRGLIGAGVLSRRRPLSVGEKPKQPEVSCDIYGAPE